MRLEEYQTLYDKMETRSEFDEQILAMTKEPRNGRKRAGYKTGWRKLAYVAAALALFAGVYQIPAVSAEVRGLVKQFTSQITITLGGKDEAKPQNVEMTGEYIKICKDASKEDRKYDTLADVEQELGISLLQSSQAYEKGSNLVRYNPHISKNGNLYGALLVDNFYVMGDLQNIELESTPEVTTNNSCIYDCGEQYQSPIGVNIVIRTDENKEDAYIDHEIEYAGRKMDLTEDENISDVELYPLKHLGVKAVLYTFPTDGVANAVERSNQQVTEYNYATFVYEGIEYIYYGAVSRDTMKEFLNTLK